MCGHGITESLNGVFGDLNLGVGGCVGCGGHGIEIGEGVFSSSVSSVESSVESSLGSPVESSDVGAALSTGGVGDGVDPEMGDGLV